MKNSATSLTSQNHNEKNKRLKKKKSKPVGGKFPSVTLRRIKIRLRDPNDPESYICEIYDTSIEDKEDEVMVQPKKMKNVFDVLMSKESRSSFNVITAVENNKLSEQSQQQVKEEPENIEKRKRKKEIHKKRLELLAGAKKQKLMPVSSEDDDVTLFQVQTKLNQSSHSDTPANCVNKENSLKLISTIRPDNQVVQIISPMNRPNSNIMNYFSKVSKEPDIEEVKTNQKNVKRKAGASHGKLAPVFTVKDTKILEAGKRKARLEFLHSGLPGSIKKAVEIQKTFELELEYFPKISHIQQRGEEEEECWRGRQINLKFKKTEENRSVVLDNKQFRFHVKADPHRAVSDPSGDCKKINKTLLNELTTCYKNTNLMDLYKDLSEKQKMFLKKEKEMEASKDDSVEIVEDCGADGPNPLWLEKYRPGESSAIVGNATAVHKVKHWLEAWKTHDALSKDRKNKSDSDSDAFLSSDDDERRCPVTVCLLQGPVAAGKTALVYALAAQLEFGVLEINASSKRTGSKLLADMQEATQSHKVQQTRTTQHSLSNFGSSKKQKRSKKRKERKIDTEEKKTKQMSLILIEDCDIYFEEQDAGFLAAVTSLINISKRPVVLTWSSARCQHLERMATAQSALSVQMVRMAPEDACAVLEVIALLEKIPYSRDKLRDLVHRNHQDLRRSLHELQYWSGEFISPHPLVPSGALWRGLGSALVEPSQHEVSQRDCGSLARLLDSLSAADVCYPPSSVAYDPDPVFSSSSSVLDGLSLADCLDECDVAGAGFSRRLTEEFVHRSLEVFNSRLFKRGSLCWRQSHHPTHEKLREWKESGTTQNSLRSVVPCGTSRQATGLDYLPVLRAICRSEADRAKSNAKRKNRFQHYLNSIGGRTSEERLKRHCQVFT